MQARTWAVDAQHHSAHSRVLPCCPQAGNDRKAGNPVAGLPGCGRAQPCAGAVAEVDWPRQCQQRNGWLRRCALLPVLLPLLHGCRRLGAAALLQPQLRP